MAAQAEIRLISSFCAIAASESALTSSFWLEADDGEVDVEDVLEHLAKGGHLLLDLDRVVLDVAQVALEFRIDPVLPGPGQHTGEDAGQRFGRPLKLDHLAGQFVGAAADVGVAAEDLGLDLVDVVFEAGDHGGVVVHHPVEDGVEDGLRPAAQQLGLVPPSVAAPGRGRARCRGAR